MILVHSHLAESTSCLEPVLEQSYTDAGSLPCTLSSWQQLPDVLCRVDCCLYAINMGYVANALFGNTTAAVTSDNTSAITIACPTSTRVQWQTADLTVVTPSLPGAASIATIYDVTGSGSNETSYVAKVNVNPTYQVCAASPQSACMRLMPP